MNYLFIFLLKLYKFKGIYLKQRERGRYNLLVPPDTCWAAAQSSSTVAYTRGRTAPPQTSRHEAIAETEPTRRPTAREKATRCNKHGSRVHGASEEHHPSRDRPGVAGFATPNRVRRRRCLPSRRPAPNPPRRPAGPLSSQLALEPSPAKTRRTTWEKRIPCPGREREPALPLVALALCLVCTSLVDSDSGGGVSPTPVTATPRLRRRLRQRRRRLLAEIHHTKVVDLVGIVAPHSIYETQSAAVVVTPPRLAGSSTFGIPPARRGSEYMHAEAVINLLPC